MDCGRCDQEPLPTCLDQNTLTVYDSPGTCRTGECRYEIQQVDCAFGCEAGECLESCVPHTCELALADCGISPDGCGGYLSCGQCLIAPPDECVDSHTVRQHLAPGICARNICQFSASEATCTAGCADGVCSGSCLPTSCLAAGAQCGRIPDGCGTILECGDCDPPLECAARGEPNECGVPCPPRQCDAATPLCRDLPDDCDGVLYCTNPCGGCAALAARPDDPCCSGGSLGTWVCDGNDLLQCQVADDLVVFSVPHHLPGDRQQLDDWHDTAVLAATIQGIVNRDAPRLFIDATDHDDLWWTRMTSTGQTLDGVQLLSMSDPVELYHFFSCALNGLVVWDDAVAATLNVATSVAGADDLAQIRYDTRPTSLYQRLMGSPAPPPIVVDLTGVFTGLGTIPGTERPSSGSAKGDAYLWLIERYVRPGRLDYRHAGYLVDAYWLDHSLGPDSTQTFNRDYMVARRAAVFDLSTWADEVPVDDPGQPLGTDHSTLKELFRAIYDLHGGSGFTQVHGFTPWAWKYTNYGDAGGGHEPVATEWDLVRLLSSYNALVDADALGSTTLANATVYSRAVLPRRRAVPAAPQPQHLRDLGVWDNRLSNAGFDDDIFAGSWTPSVTDYLTITDMGGAHRGVNRLSARATTDQPPNSISQDVGVALQPGETVRVSAWLRAENAAGTVTLAVWGLGATLEQGSTTRSLQPSDGWQRLEASMTAAHPHPTARFEVYLPVGGSTFSIDSTALWVDDRPAGVSARHYITWHMGDYDSAAWLYQFHPSRWDDPRRGEVDLAWAINPNLMDRFSIGFAHCWATATGRDHFAGGDTVAGYVNVTNLYGTREPSGLPDGRSAFEEFARPYLQRAGVQNTIFALNGSSGPFDDPAWDLLGRLTGRGVAYNMSGQTSRTPTVRNGAPFVGQDSDLDAANMDVSAQRIDETASGPSPDFHVYRIVLATPSWVVDLTERIFREHPERLYTVVSPDVLFTLILIDHGITPRYEVAFIDDDLPTTAPAGNNLSFSVTARNDGWDTWSPPTFRLGVHVADAPILAHTLPVSPTGYPSRFALPHVVGPGEVVTITGVLTLPAQPGRYYLQLDVVHEGVTWLESQGNLPWATTIELH